MKASVDKDTCIGCGLCESICSEVFTLADDGYAEAITSDVPEDCKDAPVNAIDVEE
jgi:ferredoxin